MRSIKARAQNFNQTCLVKSIQKSQLALHTSQTLLNYEKLLAVRDSQGITIGPRALSYRFSEQKPSNWDQTNENRWHGKM